MRTAMVSAVAVLLFACSSKSPPTAPPDEPPATVDTAPAPKAPVVATPRLPMGGSCDDCPAPAKCTTVVGSLPGSARKECWVPCLATEASAKDTTDNRALKKCPTGMTCTFIHDGAGEVCTYPDDD